MWLLASIKHGKRYIKHGTRYIKHGTRYIKHGTRYIKHGKRYIRSVANVLDIALPLWFFTPKSFEIKSIVFLRCQCQISVWWARLQELSSVTRLLARPVCWSLMVQEDHGDVQCQANPRIISPRDVKPKLAALTLWKWKVAMGGSCFLSG